MENKDEVKIQSTSILSEGYGLIPKKITRDKSLTMESKAIYGYLASFAGTGGQCYPSKTLMISELGTTERRFNKNIKLLKEHGYIKVHKRRKGNRNDSNLYELLMDIRDIEIAKKEFDTSQFDSGQFDSGQFDSGQFDSGQNDPPNNNSINNNSNKKNNKKGFGLTVDEYTNNPEMKTAIFDFIEFRKAIKAPLTDRALTLCLNKLDKLANDDNTKIAIINQSIERGWKGLFELHNNTSNYNKPASTVPNESDYNFEIGSFWK